MCASQDIIKQDGFFVCQVCGTKYSVEEAKKMMIEGTVDVQGTVKVDKSAELGNLYELARRAKNNNDIKATINYYEKILLERPDDWEAAFYSLLFTAKDSTYEEMETKMEGFYNGLSSVLNLVDDEDEAKNKSAFRVMFIEIKGLFKHFEKMVSEATHSLNFSAPGFEQRLKDLNKRENVVPHGKYKIANRFCLAGEKDYALTFYEEVVDSVYATPFDKKMAIQRIQEINPSYKPPIKEIPPAVEEKKSSSTTNGCYVATCVYGSYDCPQVWTLRRYRDNTLGATWYGRAFIRTYYAISPTLVKWFGKTKWFKKMWKGTLDRMVKKLQDNGVENTPYDDIEW